MIRPHEGQTGGELRVVGLHTVLHLLRLKTMRWNRDYSSPVADRLSGDKIRSMLITTGKVNNGVIQIDTQGLPDGATVTVLAHEGDETFELDAAQETELLAAITEAERGELVGASELPEVGRKSAGLAAGENYIEA